MTDERANYTSATVVEEVEEDGKVAWMQAGTVGCIDPATKTFVEGSVLKLVDGADPEVTLLEDVVAGDKVSYL